MLDKNKLLVKLENFVPKYFMDLNQEISLVIKSFNWLIDNPDKLNLILNIDSKYIMPRFYSNINNFKNLGNNKSDFLQYSILAVDGSQIYPDRHFGISCFLINIGFVHINYNYNGSNVFLNSEPYLYRCSGENLSKEIVDCKRSELEFQKGLSLSTKIIKENNNNNSFINSFIFLSDGTLLFCYTDSSNSDMKNYFLLRYIEILEYYYINKIAIFGFISFPKSKDIVNIIKTGLQANIIPNDICGNNLDKLIIANIYDFDVINQFLEPFCRSEIFSSNSKILDYYPDHLKIKFCYINIVNEIIRIEFPAWLSNNIEQLDNMLKLIIDQCVKGNGYPVVLSESHEQAVISNYDREFFMKSIISMSYRDNNKINISEKSIKKRIINI